MKQEDGGTSWVADLRYLVSTLPKGTKTKLAIYCVLQFLISFLDLLGLAVVVPVMQVINGARMDSGYIGTIHKAMGSPQRQSFVWTLCGLMVLAFALKSIFAMAASRWSLGYILRLQTLTASKLLQSYLRENYLVQRRRDVGAVVRTVGTSVASAHSGVLGGVLNLFSQLLSVSFIVIFLAVVAPGTTAAAATYFAVVILVVQRVLGRKNQRAGRQAQETSASMSHAMLEAIYGAREIRMHAAEEMFVEDYRVRAGKNAMASRDANFYSQAPKYLIEFATIFGIAIMLASVAGRQAGSILPVLTLFVAAAVKLMPVITALTVTIGSIRYGQEGLRMTVEALQRVEHDEPLLEAPPEAEAQEEDTTSALSVRGVTFRYPDGDSDVLRDVSFTVPSGSSVAVCGLSGSGKTTLIDIVLGLISPTSGAVTSNGLDVVADRQRWLQDVAYVPQDVYLLAATLWQNVAFGVPEAQVDKKRVERCLAMAQLEELVARDPAGVDALVGFEGTQISGGQKQRIGIARALYRDPKVLVLDEATSALDNDTEERISAVLSDLHGQVTTVLVAHRLSTVKHVDQLLYLEQGRIVARGTFAEVREQSAAFDHLVRLGRLDDEPIQDGS